MRAPFQPLKHEPLVLTVEMEEYHVSTWYSYVVYPQPEGKDGAERILDSKPGRIRR